MPNIAPIGIPPAQIPSSSHSSKEKGNLSFYSGGIAPAGLSAVLPADSVRFSAQASSDSEIDSIVHVVDDSTDGSIKLHGNQFVSPEFRQKVKTATRNILESLEAQFPGLKKALIQSGFTIFLRQRTTEIPLISKSDFFKHCDYAEQLEDLKQDKQKNPDIYESQISRWRSDLSDKPEIIALKNIPSLDLTDEHLKLLIYYRFIAANSIWQPSEPHFNPNLKLNGITLTEIFFDNPYSIKDNSVKSVERALRPACMRYIDERIIRPLTGQRVSERFPFRQTLIDDLREAYKKGILPDNESSPPDGQHKHSQMKLEHCFPIAWHYMNLKKEELELYEDPYGGGLNEISKQSFAEIGAIAIGGEGFWDKKLIEKFCPQSIELVKRLFKELFRQDFPQPDPQETEGKA